MFSNEIPKARLDQWIEFDKKLRRARQKFMEPAGRMDADATGRFLAAIWLAWQEDELGSVVDADDATTNSAYDVAVRAAQAQYNRDTATIADLRRKFWEEMGASGNITSYKQFWIDVFALKRRAVEDAPVLYGGKLRAAREKLGISVEQFAAMSEFSPWTVNLWERRSMAINNWATFCIYAYWSGYRPDNWPEPKKRRARSN
jgi:hypothetical protein